MLMCCFNELLVFLMGINRMKVFYLFLIVVYCGIIRVNNYNVFLLKIYYDKKKLIFMYMVGNLKIYRGIFKKLLLC